MIVFMITNYLLDKRNLDPWIIGYLAGFELIVEVVVVNYLVYVVIW